MNKLPRNVFSFLLFFMKRQRFFFFLFAVTSLSTSLSNTIWPYITGNFIDSLNNIKITDNVWSSMQNDIIIALSFWIFIEILSRLKGIVLGKFMPNFEADIRQISYEYVMNHSYHFFAKNPVGGIAHRIDDLPRSASFLVDDMFCNFVPFIIMIIISFSMLMQMHYTLSLIFIVWIVSHFTVGGIFFAKAAKYSVVQSNSKTKLQSEITDTVSNNLSVRVFDGYEQEKKRFNLFQKIQIKDFAKTLLFIEYVKVLLGVVSLIAIVLIFYSTISFWDRKLITTGDVILVVTMMLNVTNIVWYLNDEITYFIKEIGICKQSLNIVHEEIEHDKSIVVKGKTLFDGEIEFKNVSFTYPDGERVFYNKNVKIKRHERVGLVGFSGSGKTTFTNLIMKIYKNYTGEIFIDNQELRTIDEHILRKNISFIPQEPILFHRTIEENIMYGTHDATFEDIVSVSKIAKCHDFITSLKDGYKTIVGERGSKLSGGQRQRIVIARAILKNPSIIILDEATSALDSFTEQLLQKSLFNIFQNKTVIYIAHRLTTLKNMDRILLFENGAIVEEGCHADLIELGGKYSKLWDMQKQGFLTEKI